MSSQVVSLEGSGKSCCVNGIERIEQRDPNDCLHKLSPSEERDWDRKVSVQGMVHHMKLKTSKRRGYLYHF